MKSEDILIGKRYYIKYSFYVVKARCMSNCDGVYLFRFFWPFPVLNYDCIPLNRVIARVL